jgi:hypothetical protein
MIPNNVGASQVRVTNFGYAVEKSLQAETNKICDSVHKLAVLVVTHLECMDGRDHIRKSTQLTTLKNDTSAEKAREILQDHGVTFEEVKQGNDLAVGPSPVSETIMSSALTAIRSNNYSLATAQKKYPLIQHPDDLAALRQVTNGGPYQVPEEIMSSALVSIILNNHSLQLVGQLFPSIQHPDDLAELQQAAKGGPSYRVPEKIMGYALNTTRSQELSLATAQKKYPLIQHPDDLAALRQAAVDE